VGNNSTTAVAVFIPTSGAENVRVGVEVYPRPLERISISLTLPFSNVGSAVAVIPQVLEVLGSPIVIVGVELYPLPGLVILIFPTV